MTDIELKPCPFCGKETAPDHIRYDNCFVVRCLYCGYVSAHTASERGAIQNHNSLYRMVKECGNAAANADAASSCIYALCRILKVCENAIEVCMKQMCDRCRAAAELDGLEVPCVIGCETLRMAKEAIEGIQETKQEMEAR